MIIVTIVEHFCNGSCGSGYYSVVGRGISKSSFKRAMDEAKTLYRNAQRRCKEPPGVPVLSRKKITVNGKLIVDTSD